MKTKITLMNVTLNKRLFLFLAFFFILYFILAQHVFSQKQPNIVFFLSDDMSKLDASVYSASKIKTPNMEILAREGMTFQNAFIASPSCAPSRAALLTGLMPSRNGAEANSTYPHEGIQYLIKNLKDAGYEVIGFGKVGHAIVNKLCGFDYYEDVGKREDLTEHLKLYMGSRFSNKPVCAFLGDKRPHVKWINKSTYDPEDVILPPYFINTKETREHWARYCTDITGLDTELGKALNFTKESFGNNYIFMFSSDHGAQWPFAKWNLYDAGINVPLIISWPGKIKASTESLAMISWVDMLPTLLDITGGSYSDTIDGKSFLPVLMGETDKHRDVIYTTHSGDGNMNVYPIRSVRTTKFKYILNLYPEYQHTNHSDLLRKDGAGAYWDSWDSVAKTDKYAAAIIQKYHIRPAEEFYLLSDDPTEQNNLIDDNKYQKEIEELRGMLENWMEEQKDNKKLFSTTPYKASEPLPTKEFFNKK
jgi:N-sulfoglucosamine sulfohydrolase